MNYAREVFRHMSRAEEAAQPAIIAENEKAEAREISWRQLQRQSASLALELRRLDIEHLADVADSLVIDVEDGRGGSTLIMFVVPAADRELDRALESAMTAAIRHNLSARFVPDKFIGAPGIPHTLSGKKQELPMKRLFQGWPAAKVVNPDATANPDVISWYIECAKTWTTSGTADGSGVVVASTREQK